MFKTDAAVIYLQKLNRPDLAALIRNSIYSFFDMEVWFDTSASAIRLTSPKPFTDALDGLPEWDQKRILEAIFNTHTGTPPSAKPDRLELKSTAAEVSDILFPDILTHRNQLIAIGTGQGRIQDFDDYYKVRHQRISAALEERGIPNPIPFASLWDWYHKWKVEFGTYAERRRFINDLFAPLIAQVVEAPKVIVPEREPTGWERVDRAMEKARKRMESARHEEDFQTVGLLCREVFISLGQAVFDPTIHVHPDGVTPSATDAGRMIEAFFVHVAPGSSNENVRRHARASLQLASELQHKRTADLRAAALCLEATASTVNIVAIVSGQRDDCEQPGR